MKLAIFYHIAQIGLGAFIYQQQVHRLYASGLIKEADYIHFGVNGDNELFNVPDKATIKTNQNWKEETETLMSLRDFCKDNPDYKVLYFHTKGVSKNNLQTSAWRLYMEYYVIDKWKECVSMLDEYDCCGTDYYPTGKTIWSDGSVSEPKEGTTFFAGNFWWANASHINKLDNKYLESDYRLDRELWIGSIPECKGKCLHYSRINGDFGNFYEDIYSEKSYMNL
jgi:hypothetical protein